MHHLRAAPNDQEGMGQAGNRCRRRCWQSWQCGCDEKSRGRRCQGDHWRAANEAAAGDPATAAATEEAATGDDVAVEGATTKDIAAARGAVVGNVVAAAALRAWGPNPSPLWQAPPQDLVLGVANPFSRSRAKTQASMSPAMTNLTWRRCSLQGVKLLRTWLPSLLP